MEKNVLITGSSQRIGRAIAIRLAKAGWNIALHYHRSEAQAADLVRTIEDLGQKAIPIQGDLTSFDAPQFIMGMANEQLGPITALVNNASLFEHDDLATITESSYHAHLAVNLTAPVLLTKAFAAQIKDGTGNIVNIIDQRVQNLRPGFLSYTLAKSALWTLTQTSAMELAPTIRVNAIGPGPTLANKRQSAAKFKQQCEAVPLEYGPTPDEIADGVLFLVNSPSITGDIIMMDGGQHLPTSRAEED
ncbi:SDR family oxidoreductase [Sneathiella aquimaris]|uniref:SDR family oxidoreductase n=1 Tax=Sneathiella aquimaris TaxID=2599305 RepID=UPI00146B768D|nr:SDR family oxidoreductase [Sneathiella aquimaris]